MVKILTPISYLINSMLLSSYLNLNFSPEKLSDKTDLTHM